jgi:hypothetical protein
MLFRRLPAHLCLLAVVAGLGLLGSTILANGAAPRGNYVHEKAMRIKQHGGLKEADVSQFTAEELNRLRETDEVGLIVAPSAVHLPQALSKIWFKAGINPLQPSSYVLANIIDSGVVDGQVVAPVDAALLAQSTVDSVMLSKLFSFGTTWLGKTWADATPLDTFTVYSEEGVFFRDMTRHYHIDLSELTTPEEAIETLGSVTGVQDAFQIGIAVNTAEEPDPEHVARCQYWNDSSASQYYLFPYDSGGVDAYGAWDLVCEGVSDNKEVVIGIDDNGFGTDPAFHPDIRYNVSPKSRTTFNSTYNHGTKVAGVCGAAVYADRAIPPSVKGGTLSEGPGVVGVSPRTKMVLMHRLDATPFTSDLKYLIDTCGVAILNFSWGFSTFENRDLRILLEKAFYQKDIAIVAGAGNCGMFDPCPRVFYPAAYPFVLSVSGSKRIHPPDNKNLEPWGNYGPWLDVVAPAVDILTTGGNGKFPTDTASFNSGYSHEDGTSLSAAIASGVAALLKTANPALPAATLYDILAQTAIPLEDQPAPWTEQTGWGQIDARGAALQVINPPHCDSLPGDANGDCFINWGDALLIVNYLVGLATLPEPDNADVNADCTVDFSDFTMLVDYLTTEGVTLLSGCFESGKIEAQVSQALPQIDAAFPNPFNPVTTIQYSLPQSGHVTLEVFNTLGQLVRTLVDEEQEAGTRSAAWDGKNNNGKESASGVYLFRLATGAGTATKKMVLLK